MKNTSNEPIQKSTQTSKYSIFTTAGFPSSNSLHEQIRLFDAQDIDFIEVGIPFSDPLADGPVIQETSAIAIKNGITIDEIFTQLAEIKSPRPIVLMGYINPVMNYGFERFLQKASKLNVAGIILPDMSVEIYERYYRTLFNTYAVNPIFLITPKTDEARIRKVAELCKNSFVYLVSSNSTTGSSTQVSLGDEVVRIKSCCGDTPLMIGFGIKDRATVEYLWNYADGVIIGSAFLKAVMKNSERAFLEEITSSSLQ
jgi:tryptophan synthase alpha chain